MRIAPPEPGAPPGASRLRIIGLGAAVMFAFSLGLGTLLVIMGIFAGLATSARGGVWTEYVKKGFGDVLGSLAGRARDALPGAAGVLSDSLGSAATDLESALITRLAGADRLLFRGSHRLPAPGDYRIAGNGEGGTYAIDFTLRTL